MFKGQPKGLFALALANTGERFGYYTMLAIFMLFLQAKFGWNGATASQVYAIFLAAVYFMPVVGGWLADKIGYGKCVVTGIAIMFAGYVCLSIPTPANALGVTLMIGALALIAIGTGLFKGNLQVLVGNLYDDPKYSAWPSTSARCSLPPPRRPSRTGSWARPASSTRPTSPPWRTSSWTGPSPRRTRRN